MASKNGAPELVSLLQYMKNTTLDNEEIVVKDERLVELDRIVNEVKQSEEWEAVRMNILEIGMERGKEIGIEQGKEIGIEQGREIGIEQGREIGIEQGIRALVETSMEFGNTQKETLERIITKMQIPREKAEKYVEKYWH